jgi:sugar lactone lactonase YvrE
MGKKEIFIFLIFKSILSFYRPTYVEPLYIIDNYGLGLQGASGLAIDSNDRIYISDTGHHRIVICTPEGCYITHIGIEGDGPGELKLPSGLDITHDGTIVVADTGNKRLQLFGSIREQTIEENNSTPTKADDKNILLIDPENLAI